MPRMSARNVVDRALATPRGWPVRWRLAAVSATLTLVILVGFAAVVGRLTTNKLENDFRSDLRDTASRLAIEIQAAGRSGTDVIPPSLSSVMTSEEGVRVVDGTGEVVIDDTGRILKTPGAPDPGSPDAGSVVDVGRYEVATAAIATTELGPQYFIQYARDHSDLERTMDRLWLFLSAGVLIGTAFAYLAGLAVAVRAMRPISSLTAAARKIESTRDPSRRMPEPGTDDEVAELAHTLGDMLRALDEARSETEATMQRQREFVADASHELRTPLTSILANLELLHASLEDAGDDEDRTAVTSALRSSRRMRGLVADLLLLARADAGRAGPREECDLGEVALGAVAEVRPVADGHEITIDDEGPVAVEANPDELHRMILNLLENGVRHTPDGTNVRVRVARDDDGALLEVSDDGPGIAPEMRETVFSRFVRGAGPSDRASGDGAGLGLAIVAAVAVSHGGEATVGDSDEGGARFTVRLPALPVRAPDEAVATPG